MDGAMRERKSHEHPREGEEALVCTRLAFIFILVFFACSLVYPCQPARMLSSILPS